MYQYVLVHTNNTTLIVLVGIDFSILEVVKFDTCHRYQYHINTIPFRLKIITGLYTNI